MNPPDGRSVDCAIDTLLGSIREENLHNTFLKLKLSSAAAGEIESLRSQAEALSLAASTMSDVAIRRAMRLHTQANGLLPINRLPTELMTKIFSFTVRRGLLHHYYRRLYILMRVCKLWTDVISACPVLWSVLSSTHPWNIVSLALHRSKDAPLHLLRPVTVTSSLNSWSYIPEYNEIICKHIHRWKIAELVIVREGGLYGDSPWLQVPAPLLESLTIVATLSLPGVYAYAPVDIFNGSAPKLRQLDLSGFPVRWSSPIFENLHTLSLYDIRKSELSMATLLDLLSRSQCLKQLRLEHLVLNDDSPTELQPGDGPGSIYLPRLQQTSFIRLDVRVIDHILSFLRTPNCESYMIDCDLDRRMTWLPFDPTSTPQLVESFRKMISSATKMSIVLWPHTSSLKLQVWSGEKKEAINLRLDVESPINLLMKLIQMLDISSATLPIFIRLQRGPYNATELLQIFDSLPSIAKLDFGALSSGDLEYVLDYLARPANGGWHCPHLKSLTLRDCRLASGPLLHMIGARYGTGGNTIPSAARLTSLLIQDIGFDTSHLDVIKQIVGPDVVVWEGVFDSYPNDSSSSEMEGSTEGDEWEPL